MSNREGNTYFEKQRDLLIQEIGNSMDSVIYNLDILNRSLNNSIQVGKEFDDVGRLWSHFYDGVNQYKARRMDEQVNAENLESDASNEQKDRESESVDGEEPAIDNVHDENKELLTSETE